MKDAKPYWKRETAGERARLKRKTKLLDDLEDLLDDLKHPDGPVTKPAEMSELLQRAKQWIETSL